MTCRHKLEAPAGPRRALRTWIGTLCWKIGCFHQCLCAGYIQITADQKDLWDTDANAFVADEEDDMVSVRTSGQLVLDELLRQADGAAGILAGAVHRRLDEAAHAKVLNCRKFVSLDSSSVVP